MPAGTSLDESGIVRGTLTTPGPFSYTIKVQSLNNNTTTQTVSGIIAHAATTLTVTSTPSAVIQAGQPYSQTNVASGGTAPYTFALAIGELVDGLVLNSATGTVSRTPLSGSVGLNYTIQVTDSGSPIPQATNRSIHSFIDPAGPVLLTVAVTASPVTQAGKPYLQTVVASGGIAPYSFSLDGTVTPPGTSFDAATGTVSGTPVLASNFIYKIKATDSSNPPLSGEQGVSGTMAQPIALSLAATPSPTMKVGILYSQANVASGGVAPYHYSFGGGGAPPGTTLDPTTGTVWGTPTRSGPFGYVMSVTDSGSPAQFVTQSVSGTMDLPDPLSLAVPPSLVTQVGQPYSQTSVASGGTPPYTYSVTGGGVPPGTSLNAATGTVSGTPINAGTFVYFISVRDSRSPAEQSATLDVRGTMAAPVAVNLTATPSATTVVGKPYSQANAASGGTAPYTFSIASGTVPPGTTLDTATGTVSGTPTTAGAFAYLVRVRDSSAPSLTTTQQVDGTMTLPPPLSLVATRSAERVVGQPYSQTNVASGGVAPYTYSVRGGVTPPGTTLDTATGTVSGTPTTPGSFAYTIRVTDSNSPANTMQQNVIGSVTPVVLSLAVTPSAVTQVGQPYSQTSVASGGIEPYTYSVDVGTIPPGTTLDTTTGTVSGMPTTGGAFSYTIKVTDDDAQTATQAVSGSMGLPPALSLAVTPSAATEVGQFYAQTSVVSGGTAPYSYSVSGGAIPPGTTLNTTTGAVLGTPTARRRPGRRV